MECVWWWWWLGGGGLTNMRGRRYEERGGYHLGTRVFRLHPHRRTCVPFTWYGERRGYFLVVDLRV